MSKNLEKIIQTLLKKKNLTRETLSMIKRKHAADFGIPTNTQLLQAYHDFIKKNKAKPQPCTGADPKPDPARRRGVVWGKRLVQGPILERLLKKREIRTLSGVAPIAVLTKPYPCPGKCIYCPTEKNMPKSYLSNEPAVMRAILNKFDPYKQVQMRLRALEANGHPTDKCELIIMGGTWSYLPKSYQTNFIKKCFQAFNEFGYKKDLRGDPRSRSAWRSALKANEHAKHRVVGLTLETRPDYINKEEILRMRELGCTRVELGVQSIYDDILKLNQRGSTRADIIKATKLLKNAGFKITYHMMPNLPGSNPTRDLKMFKELFTNSDFQPDQLKIYPCVVTKNSKLYSHLRKNKYKPYSQKQLINLLIKIKKIIPPYVRIARLIRDIPSESIIAGNKTSNLRQYIQKEMEKTGKKCKCIRCREIRGTDYKISNVKLKKREYNASKGKEIFLSYEDIKQNKIIAFLRLRLPQKSEIPAKGCLPASGGVKASGGKNLKSAIIREVHTYGTMIPVGQSGKVQHRGFGKKLTKQAEKIAKSSKHQHLAVISGIGVRDYYRKLGYKLQDEYMTKKIDKSKRIVNNK